MIVTLRSLSRGVNLSLLLTVIVALVILIVGPKEIVYEREIDPGPELEIIEAIVTAYSSTPDQTDSTPFITASNQKVRKGIAANNCLKFGSKVEIDNEIFEIQDRMNKRYGCEYFDIWFENRKEARLWGKQNLKVLVLAD